MLQKTRSNSSRDLIKITMIHSAWSLVLFSATHLQPGFPQREVARLTAHCATWMNSITCYLGAYYIWDLWTAARAARQRCRMQGIF